MKQQIKIRVKNRDEDRKTKKDVNNIKNVKNIKDSNMFTYTVSTVDKGVSIIDGNEIDNLQHELDTLLWYYNNLKYIKVENKLICVNDIVDTYIKEIK